MNSIICQTQISNIAPAKAILVSKSLLDQFGLQSGQSIKVQLGNNSVITNILSTKSLGNKIIFPFSLAKVLTLPFTGNIRAIAQHRTIKLGPVIGILTTGFQANSAAPFGGRSSLFRSFIQAGEEEKTYFYVFTPEMIDWQNKIVTGWYYRGNQWKRFLSPLPDVVYERIPNRKSESLSGVQSCLNRLKELTKCQVFNQGFFDKWSVHEWLSKDEQTESYMPETVLSPSISKLKQMLDEYAMVYLKPVRGSLGLGIFRITRHPQNGYYCRFHGGEKNILHRFQTLDGLIAQYFGKSGRRFKGYLAQQGIRLIKVNNRPVDFRVHLHKDKSDTWKAVGTGAKLAGIGCVTTHVRTGGSLLSTDHLFKQTFSENALLMKRKLEDVAIQIAEILEENISGPIGEIGMDLGIDQQGLIWLFECNAKPGRHIFDHPTLKEAGRRSAKCITDYSLKLAEFV